MISCVGFVNSRFSSNSYIIAHQDYTNVWLIDPGDVQPILLWMRGHEKESVSGIILTHTHFDHIYGINELLEQFPDSRIYVANEIGKEALYDAKKNASRYTEYGPIVIKDTADVRMPEPLMTLWPDVVMQVMWTPGHSEDSLCFVVDNMMFTGDTLINNVRTVTKLRGGSEEKLKRSMAQISQFVKRGFVIFPGHGEVFNLDDCDLNNSCRQAYAD